MRALCIALVSCFVVLGCIVNLYPYLGFDAATFYYGGLSISRGGLPYVDFIDNKPPGIFYLLALPASWAPWNPFAALLMFRAIDLVLFLLVGLLLHYFVRSFWVELVTLFSFWVSYLNTFASTYETIYCEMPEAICLVAAYLLVLKGRTTFVPGLILGVAIMFRQPAVIHLVGLAGVVIVNAYYNKKRLVFIFRELISLLVGVGSVILIVAYAAWRGGWLEAWRQCTFVWPFRYMEAFAPFWTRIPLVLSYLIDNEFLVAFGVGIIIWMASVLCDFAIKNRSAIRVHLLLLMLLVASLVEVSLTGVLRRHQFIPLLPAVVAIHGVAIARFIELISISRQRICQIFLLLISVVFSIRPAIGVSQEMFSRLFFFQEREVARHLGAWISSRTEPNDFVWVWGFAPQIYLEAKRFSGVAQFHNLLLNNINGAFELEQGELIKQLERDLKEKRPRYIIELANTDIRKIFPWINAEYRNGVVTTPYGSFKYLERGSYG